HKSFINNYIHNLSQLYTTLTIINLKQLENIFIFLSSFPFLEKHHKKSPIHTLNPHLSFVIHFYQKNIIYNN
ncbi:hypothetical protein EBI_25766, partial [Enterocytozoon bieneusi H348]